MSLCLTNLFWLEVDKMDVFFLEIEWTSALLHSSVYVFVVSVKDSSNFVSACVVAVIVVVVVVVVVVDDDDDLDNDC